MAKSFRQMTAEGTIKRADSEKIEHHNFHIEPGFNVAGRTDQDDEDDESLFDHICAGGYIPPLEVRPRDGGEVWIVDGHRRHKQVGRAIAAGKYLPDPKDGKYWLKVVQFTGSDIKRTARLLTSNRRKDVTENQEAEVYSRLRAFGLSTTDIAKECNAKRPRVDQLLALLDANHDVQDAVKSGDISRTLAVSITRTHGEAAGAVIATEVAKAKAAGAKRVTAATMKPWAPPAKLALPIVTNARRLLDSMPPEVVARASNAARFDDPDEQVTITMSSRALFLLAQMVHGVEEMRVEDEEKRAAKAAKVGAEGGAA